MFEKSLPSLLSAHGGARSLGPLPARLQKGRRVLVCVCECALCACLSRCVCVYVCECTFCVITFPSWRLPGAHVAMVLGKALSPGIVVTPQVLPSAWGRLGFLGGCRDKGGPGDHSLQSPGWGRPWDGRWPWRPEVSTRPVPQQGSE